MRKNMWKFIMLWDNWRW